MTTYNLEYSIIGDYKLVEVRNLTRHVTTWWVYGKFQSDAIAEYATRNSAILAIARFMNADSMKVKR